jgi:WD40 repeat protein
MVTRWQTGSLFAVPWIKVIDASSGRETTDIGNPRIFTFCLVATVNQIACGGEMVSVRDGHAGSLLGEYGGTLGGPIQVVSWSPDGAFLAAGGPDNAVRIWEVKSGRREFVYDLHDVLGSRPRMVARSQVHCLRRG